MNETLIERLRQSMYERRMNQSELAAAADVSKATVSNVLSGKFDPRYETLVAFADALRVDVGWLMGNSPNNKKSKKGVSHAAIEAGVATNKGAVRIPVLSEIAAGIPIEAMENHIDDNDPNTWEEIPKEWTIGGKEYFALQVSGNSMEPQIPNGSIAIIEKCYEWHSGKIMAVYINGYNATLKRVHVKSGGIIVLEAFNSEYETKVYTADEVESIPVRPCGVLIETRKKW